MMNFKKQKGFTLVELLVVIAIIALLMGILMPALNRVRAQGQATVCRSNLKQWGNVFLMYTNDYHGVFHGGYIGKELWWMEVTKDYYDNNKDLLYCPSATKKIHTHTAYGGKYEAWGPYSNGSRGSLGLNLWVCNPSPEITGVGAHGKPASYCWRTTNVNRAGDIPMMLDCMSFGGLPLNSYDEPVANIVIPTEDSLCDNSVSGTGYFCVNRHFGSVNAVFLDFSARQVALKQLWRLRWHRKYDTTEEYPEWPEWMRGFPVD